MQFYIQVAPKNLIAGAAILGFAVGMQFGRTSGSLTDSVLDDYGTNSDLRPLGTGFKSGRAVFD